MDTEDSTTNVIEFNYSQTQDEVAEEVTTVLNEAFESLDADNYEGGIVHLGSELGMHLPTSLYESSLTITGLPGTTVDYGLTVGSVDNLTAGQTFTISSGPNAAERFEFVEDVDMITEGNHPIVFNPDTTVESLAVTIALEIEKTDLGLQPVLLGGGNIALHGSTTAYTMDLVGTTLTQYGTAGAEANVALPFIPHQSFTEQDMATMVASVIVANDDLEGVTALPVDDTVEIGGAASVTGATAISYTGVQDIAGNKLQNNQIDGTTTFTLNLNSGMDHADALGYDNASHEVVSDLRLGDTVDVEPEPLANEDATGDLSDDGVTFDQMLIVNGAGLVTVAVNGVPVDAPAFLNAWLDQDGDGEFDTNEKIIDSAAVTNGNQTFPFAIAEAAVSGSTIARFRLSTEEAVGPIGDAVSGEVEDYQVMIHRSGWQNPAIAEDVNYDGHVSPIDALLVINHLNVTDPVTLGQPLPIPENGNEPPPFLDVSGDNRIAPIDALMVINKLSQIVDSGGEGEFVPAVVAAISRSNVGTLTVVHDVVAEPEIDLERVREEQFSTLSLHGPELLEDVLTEIADDVRQSDLEDSDEFFANIRFE